MKRKRGCMGCFTPVLFIIIAVFLLYYAAGNGKNDIMKKLYPIKYQEYVEKYADEYSLDRYLVYSIIKVESGFNPDAVSAAGAKGLMQLMDNTAEECSRKNDFGYSIPGDLFEPEKNIRMGCCYLRNLMDTYGDMTLVITAYNGGTGNVRKWLGDESLADGEGGLANIPYEETKKYVDKVLNAYSVYTRLYTEKNI